MWDPLYSPVRIVDARADHLHGPLSYPAGADVPPQSQVQDQPQRAGQGAGEHHTNLGQPGQSRRQLKPITRAQDVRSQLSQEEDEEAAGEDRRDDGAQSPVQEDTQDRVSHRTQEQQRTSLDGGKTGRHKTAFSSHSQPAVMWLLHLYPETYQEVSPPPDWLQALGGPFLLLGSTTMKDIKLHGVQP